MNSEKIFTLLNDSRELLDGDERTAGGIEAVESAMNYIQRAAYSMRIMKVFPRASRMFIIT